MSSELSPKRAKALCKSLNKVIIDLRGITSHATDTTSDIMRIKLLYDAYRRFIVVKSSYHGYDIKEQWSKRANIITHLKDMKKFTEMELFFAESIYGEAMDIRQKIEEYCRVGDERKNHLPNQKENGATPTNQPQNGPTERS